MDHLLFLNRCSGGATVVSAQVDDPRRDASAILDGTIYLHEYPFGDASWNQVVSHVREIFAPFSIAVTDVDPGDVPHDEVFVCAGDVPPGLSGAAGAAPFACEPIANAVSFVFPKTLGDNPRRMAETAAQEAAHAWGLDHTYKCEDPMTYLEGCGDKAFQDGAYPCGELAPRDCYCGGSTQNTYRHLLAEFGAAVADTEDPTATIISPVDGDDFELGAEFDITVEVSDDVEVLAVRLLVDGEPAATDEEPPFDGWIVDNLPLGEYELAVKVKDTSGNVGTSNAVSIVISDGEGGRQNDWEPTPSGIAPTAPLTGQDATAGCGCSQADPGTGPFLTLAFLLGVALGLVRRGGRA